MVVKAEFISIWDGSTEVRTACNFNTVTKEATDVESTDDVEDLDILFEEYIELQNGEIIKDFIIDGEKVVDGQRD